MTRHLYSFDKKCGDIAEAFLADVPWATMLTPAEFSDLTAQFAQHIQDAIDDWLVEQHQGRKPRAIR